MFVYRVKPSLIHTQWHHRLQFFPKILYCIYYVSMLYIWCFYFLYIYIYVVYIIFLFCIYYVTNSDSRKIRWCLHWIQYLHGTDYFSTFVPSIYYITTETVYKLSKCHLKTSMSMGIFVRCEWFLRPAPINHC